MVSNKDLLSNSCDKLNSEGYGSGQGQRMQFLLDRKRHNSFWVRSEICLKRKVLTVQDFKLSPH